MSDAFDVPIEIADVTIVGPLPLPVTGTFTPSGTQDVNIVSSVPLAVTQSTNPWITDGSGFIQPVSGTVTSLQGTSPWVISGSVSASQLGAWSVAVNNFPAIQPISGTVTALQGTSPWVVSGTVAATQSGAWTTGRTWTLSSGTDSVASVQSGAWSVAVNNFPATQPVSGTVTANQGTSPWVVSGTVTANAGTNLNTSALALETTLGARLADATFTGRINTLGQKTSANSTPVVLASDNVVSVQPAVTSKGFSASMTKTAIGTTELNSLFLKNPSGSGKTLIISSFTFGNNHTVDGSWVRLRIYSNPTTSANGSAITVGTLAVGSGATAVATPFNTPTSSANGQLLYDANVYSGSSQVFKGDGNLTIAANNTIMVTVVADAAARSSNMTMIWNEI